MRFLRHFLTLPINSSFHILNHKVQYEQHALYLGCFKPKSRRTRLRSALCIGRSLSKPRRTRLDFVRRLWLRRPLSRRSLPLPVILYRLAVALWVFILGIIRLLLPGTRRSRMRFLTDTDAASVAVSFGFYVRAFLPCGARCAAFRCST